MKKIITTFLISLFSIVSAFAETTIEFSSDKKAYNIEENIQLNIELETDNLGETRLNIEGIDNFQVVGKRQSQSRKNINGQISSQFNLQLSLIAEKSGEYVLGPVSTVSGSGTINSEVIKIKVSGERIMVNTQLNNLQNNNPEEPEEENIDDVNLNTPGETLHNSPEDIEVTPKKIVGVDGEEMTNIYSEKGFLYGNLFSKNSLIFLAISLLGIIFYIILKKYLKALLKSSKVEKTKKREQKIKPKKEINYSQLLEKLKKNYIDSEKELFYAQTGKVFRTYLDDKVKEGLSKGSLKEVELFLGNTSLENKKQILSFYQKIYFPEYSQGNDDLEQRKSIVDELEKLIIVKKFK